MIREPDAEARVREHLIGHGYNVGPRLRQRGHDVLATKDGRRLLVEVKGDRPGHRSSRDTVYVDVCTLLGQIVLRKGQGEADDYAIGVRPVHLPLIWQAIPALKVMNVKVLLVADDSVRELS